MIDLTFVWRNFILWKLLESFSATCDHVTKAACHQVLLLCRPNIGIACLEVTEGRVVLINADRAVSCHRWVSLRTDAGAFTFASAAPEIAYAVEAESAPPRYVQTLACMHNSG